MIPVYNCARYLPEVLNGVLAQQLGEQQMQIEVVDDASTDADIAEIVRRVGKGRVAYFRQTENVGSLRNFETCINRSQGRLIHLLHGDDRVRPGFYQEMEKLFITYPQAGAAFCRFGYINEVSQIKYIQPSETDQREILSNWLLKISVRNRIQYAAVVVKREVYERLGSFYGVTYGEDWEMWARIAGNYPIAYTPCVLADYRKHMHSISGTKFTCGGYLKDLLSVMHYIQQHVPVEQRSKVLEASKKFYSHYSMRVANELWNISHNDQETVSLIKEIVHLHKDYWLCLKIIKLKIKIFVFKNNLFRINSAIE